LQNGDHLTREEFERRYDATPGLKKAELINGVVYMSPPVAYEWHSQPHVNIAGLLWLYCVRTSGVRSGIDATLRLQDDLSQPDAFLFLDPTMGGQVKLSEDGYIEGAPEFICEVAASSASYDVHLKLDLYSKAGVKEYLVWRTYDGEWDLFERRADALLKSPFHSSGQFRSVIFPGLWIDVRSLLAQQISPAIDVLNMGLASPEHQAFAQQLQQRSTKP